MAETHPLAHYRQLLRDLDTWLSGEGVAYLVIGGVAASLLGRPHFNSVETREIEITQADQEFRFPVKGKLQSVLLDPDNDFLMRPPRWVVEGAE